MVTDAPDGDLTRELADLVREASARGTALRIVGGDTKAFYGRPVAGDPLRVAGHAGVVHYDPAELVLTARCGTRLDVIETLLERHGQHLAFDPPAFGPHATIGGVIAAGLAGPARVARGPVRDYVLGARLLTGDGRVLRFGGEVMKNVAGYDVSRLLAGSLGVLGVILEISLKVLPAPVATRTLRRALGAQDALERLASGSQRGLPLTASFWHAGELLCRLEGAPGSLDAAQSLLGGDVLGAAEARDFWRDVREQRLGFYAGGRDCLWRITAPALAPLPSLPPGHGFAFEWHGGQRWFSGVDEQTARSVALSAGGHATRFRAGPRVDRDAEVFAPLAGPLLELHRRVKRVFDPAGILNRGRLYASL